MKKRMALFIGILCCFVLMAGAAFAEEPGAAATVNDGHVHIASCNMPNECIICHATTELGITIEHIFHGHHGYVLQYDAKEHWWACLECGEIMEHEEHMAYCDDPDTCVECGKSVDDGIVIDGFRIWHVYDWENIQYNEKEHWWVCNRCGEITEHEEHMAYCDDPDTCVQCGKSVDDGIVIDDFRIWHYYDVGENIQYNEKEHWWVCLKCGEICELAAHWAHCDEPDVCVQCEKSVDDGIIIDRISHHFDWDFQYNAKEHWGVCLRCGETIMLELHEFVDGKCCYCDYEPTAGIRGDANGDENFALDDIMIMIDYYCGSGSIVSANCDLDNDGAACTLADIMVAIDLYCSI